MTLCKYRPQRVYGEQLLIDRWELAQLIKMLEKRAVELGDNGELDALLYTGAVMGLSTLCRERSIEYWTEYMDEFRRMVAYETEGGTDGS